jgi:site-specific DNA recombinase
MYLNRGARYNEARDSGIQRRNMRVVALALVCDAAPQVIPKMAKAWKPTRSRDPARKHAVIYARVSSKEQEKEGFSIPAQLKLLKEYAAAQGFTVAEEYVDVETAKQSGRASFGAMVAYLRVRPSVRVLLVEKTDRLYRNLKDWVTVDELDVEIHFPKEGVVLSRDSRSSEKFMHGIKVLMAKNYIDNLSEEARKGMQEKAEQGIWPTVAPLGYRNVVGPDGKKIIEPDPETAPIIVRLFEWYASGSLSLREVVKKVRAAGLVRRKSGAPVPTSTVHSILRNRLYSGEFEWNGRRYVGKHQPLVSPELWEQVQAVLDGRHAKKHRRAKHEFAFSGLIACGHCGCSLVGELKKQRYVYYHCTGYKGRCGDPYVREEVFERHFCEMLGRLRLDSEVLDWVREALHASHADEKREQEAAITALQAQQKRLQHRLEAIYIDKLDGKVDAALYDRMSTDWRAEQARCLREIEHHQAANRSYMDEGVHLLELAQDAQRLFEKQKPREKRRLLNFLVSNCTWKGGELTFTLRQPFDLVAETALADVKKKAADDVADGFSQVWLPGPDSNQRPSG